MPVPPGVNQCPNCGQWIPQNGGYSKPGNGFSTGGIEYQTSYTTLFKAFVWGMFGLDTIGLLYSLGGLLMLLISISAAQAAWPGFGMAYSWLEIWSLIIGILGVGFKMSGYLMLGMQKGSEKVAVILLGVGIGFNVLTMITNFFAVDIFMALAGFIGFLLGTGLDVAVIILVVTGKAYG